MLHLREALAQLLPTIDAHVHTVFQSKPDEHRGMQMSLEQLQREMSMANIAKAVAFVRFDAKGNQDFRKLGIHHCINLGPDSDIDQIEKRLKNRRYIGMKVYSGYVYRYPDDKIYRPFYELAESLGIPVVFHTGDIDQHHQGRIKYSQPLLLDDIAMDHPKMRIVIAHAGNPWIKTAAEVAYKNPNVWVDLSGFLIGGNELLTDRTIGRTMIEPIRWLMDYLGPSKALYGSDWPIVDMSVYQQLIKTAIEDIRHWPAVFYQNAQEIYGI